MNYFNLISLGCPKNRVDSEKILHAMFAAGFKHTEDQQNAQVLIINTCAFIQPAVEESIAVILDSSQLNPMALLVVAGCLPLRYKQKLQESFPEVDLFITPEQIEEFAESVQLSLLKKIEQLKNSKKPDGLFSSEYQSHSVDGIGDECGLSDNSAKAGTNLAVKEKANDSDEFNRVLSTPGFAYLRVSDGCDHGCKFCSIPLIRGKLRSEAIEDLVREATTLSDLGVKELVLVAQDLSSYGRDLGIKNGLVRLLEQLESIRGIEWIRLMYLYPSGVNSDLIDMIHGSQKILPYVDVPIQHISDRVLKSMGRPWNGKKIKDLIDLMRSRIPEIVIRTTVMVGYPTEEDSDFDELKHFISEFRLDHVGVFTYFQEEGSPSEKLGDPIQKKVKNARARAIRSIHSTFMKKRNKRKVGRIESSIVEGISEESDLLLEGRVWDQAPEVDGKLYITSGTADVGAIKRVLITGANGVDLFGEIQD